MMNGALWVERMIIWGLVQLNVGETKAIFRIDQGGAYINGNGASKWCEDWG